jgi:hypothetical protein
VRGLQDLFDFVAARPRGLDNGRVSSDCRNSIRACVGSVDLDPDCDPSCTRPARYGCPPNSYQQARDPWKVLRKTPPSEAHEVHG